jgi:hypothetical protein
LLLNFSGDVLLPGHHRHFFFWYAKQHYSFLSGGIKPLRLASLFIRLIKPEYCNRFSIKKSNGDGPIGSKSK